MRLDLFRRSKLALTKEDSRKAWNSFRRSKQATPALEALAQMSGKRVRCFYCGDSIGADIDHYWPIARKCSLTFSWHNWLLVCPNCNRHKSDSFPVDAQGHPLLLNPATQDPWKHFVLDAKTGLIAPRYKDEAFDEVGEATLDVLDCLLNEAIAEGRLRVIRRLQRAVKDLLSSVDLNKSWARLLQEVSEDDFGVSLWLFAWEGSQEEPFLSFRTTFPNLARRTVSYAVQWPYAAAPGKDAQL
ncbi:HNH endonuclease [Nonomuraea roseoviolacea]|uniref:5-methylcytosine-specific restriction endonuclease McrA n=1 Tax=Nonomuraea roseoviolacea subsp. carminata TaxID=160689 RepID=A0ABT1K6W1_9ACTN|nr:HNH endonuclease [Nonomuraea roseoviolacea]MCP2349728.1 5-methylcytosine-specific restriction endonuclease McrA [Nonomuraea roseoviolacea subsp. carminata]